MEKTIRQRIESYQSEISAGNLMPQRAAEILVEISALLGNINNEIVTRDIAYNKVLLDCYNTQESANRAKIVAGTLPEYEAMRQAKNTKEAAVDLERSLKYFLKASEEEFRASRNL
jgi:hypothetical protein